MKESCNKVPLRLKHLIIRLLFQSRQFHNFENLERFEYEPCFYILCKAYSYTGFKSDQGPNSRFFDGISEANFHEDSHHVGLRTLDRKVFKNFDNLFPMFCLKSRLPTTIVKIK